MKSLFLRIFLWFSASTLLLILVGATALVVNSPGAFSTGWQQLGRGAIRSVGHTAAQLYEEGGTAELENYVRGLTQDTGMLVALVDSTGRALGGSQFTPEPAVEAKLTASPEEGVVVMPLYRVAGIRLRGPSGMRYEFVMTIPARPGERGRVFVIAFLLMGGVLCFLLARHLTSPMIQLRALTSRFSQGDLTARIASPELLQRRDEIGGLARDFNQMAGRIENLLKAQHRLLADVSHELRSPLTRLSLALGLMKRRVSFTGQVPLRVNSDPPHVARMEREVERLNHLIGQLLTLSRLENLDHSPQMEPIDLSALVQEIAVDADFEAASMDRSVRLAECAACTMRGARDLMRSAVENVVRNALKYTRPGTQVRVRLARANGSGMATIVVEDEGPGVPAKDLAHVFEPFYRVDEARDRQSGGAGLGLAITHQVVSLHGGSVSAANREGGGLELRLTLPVYDAL
jgi:two-component system sensor histidine kinase CpxA